ncbi:MAG TPA: MFS transporter [Steroidobacteraceae bacterium]|nr:MFS transporter [Steroidobacteraceae bacterium]
MNDGARPSPIAQLRRRFALGPTDLLRDATYRRLWSSILISSFGGQVTLLALPLSAAVLLHASPTEMGVLTAAELVPFVLFSLPTGVWLDRVRKLPVYIVGELSVAATVASVPVAWRFGWLSMSWLYLVGFVIGAVNTTAGSAAQIVLTQIVPRERLVEAHAKNALASSTAEVTGPGAAGALIKVTGAPLALLADATLLLVSASILRGVAVRERPSTQHAPFWPAMQAGLDFVRGHRLLVAMASCVGFWQLCNQSAMVVQILFATRLLGLSERAVGLSYVALGVGTVAASALGNRIVRRLGPGPTLVLGFAVCGTGWLGLACAPLNPLGVLAYALMLLLYGIGAVFIFINFLSLRQSVTPGPMLGRMTSTMRWLILLPAGPGALWGGWLGEHFGLRAALGFAGIAALALALVAVRLEVIRSVKTLPSIRAEAVTPYSSDSEEG